MPVKPNKGGLQNYVPPGNPDGGEYDSGSAEKGAIPKDKLKSSTIPLKDKIAKYKEKIQGNAKPNRLEKLQDKLDYIAKNSKTTIELKGITPERQEEIVTTIYEHYEEFPELSKDITYMGGNNGFVKKYLDQLTNKTVDAYMNKIGGKVGDATVFLINDVKKKMKKYLEIGKNEGAIAISRRNSDNSISAIILNEHQTNSPETAEMLKNNAKIGFHAKGSGTIKYIVDHELGHKLNDLYKITSNAEIISIYNGAKEESEANSQNEIRKKYMQANTLSRYGYTNISEFVAEAWAEYRNNPNPREIAAKVGRAIENARDKNK